MSALVLTVEKNGARNENYPWYKIEPISVTIKKADTTRHTDSIKHKRLLYAFLQDCWIQLSTVTWHISTGFRE